MVTVITGGCHIPPPAAAVARGHPADAAGGGPERLDRIARLPPERLAETLAFLSGYAPGVFDAILAATEPCFDDLFPADTDDEDGADEGAAASAALEPYCTRCGAKAGIFAARGEDWLHYAGTPHARTVRPFDTDHAPVIGWRPAQDGPAIVGL